MDIEYNNEKGTIFTFHDAKKEKVDEWFEKIKKEYGDIAE